jgi:UDP-N-acetylglucosamine 2-epimerase (non-hydrolysing)
MAPVVRALRQFPERIVTRVCVTAQHRQMLDQVLEIFGIAPDIDLDLMQPNQSLSALAARVLSRLDPLLEQEQPDWVLVQGDTTTVMASAIAAHHRRVRVGHVEAGLRTGDRANPFPEEMNRVVADHISDLCFAPTERARQNLLREGIADAAIRVTGNTVVDALQEIAARPWTPSAASALSDSALAAIPPDARLILVTAHRRESFGAPLERICQALLQLARRPDVRIVYAVHLNPQVQEPVHRLLDNVPNITLLPPLDYLTLIQLMKRSYLILTDSGGIQEEAPSLGAPVLVLRDVTERPEAVEAGVARLVGADTGRIVAEAARLLDDPQARAAMARAVNPYGDGRAAERIVQALLEQGEPRPTAARL